MGVMTQDNFFIYRNNQRKIFVMGKLDATDEEIIEAAKAVHAPRILLWNKNTDMIPSLEKRGGKFIRWSKAVTSLCKNHDFQTSYLNFRRSYFKY